MIVEMHCHTAERSACSHVQAVDLLQRAYQTGIQTVVLTDHHYRWPPDELTQIQKAAGLPDIFTVLAGQEVGTDMGHVLVYGAVESFQQRADLTVREIREKCPQAAIVWAHPYRNGKVPKPEDLLNPVFDAIEIFSSNYAIADSLQALEDWHTYKFTAISGTDTHAYSYAGTYPTIFDHPFDSIEAMAEEIKAGRCRPYFKEVPRTGTTNTVVREVTIGPKAAHKRKKMIVKTYENAISWKNGQRTHHIVEALCEHGFDTGAYRVPKPLACSSRTLTSVEQRIKGPSLVQAMLDAKAEQAGQYLQDAASWLLKMHNARLEITPKNEYLQIEPNRLYGYLVPLIEVNHRHADRVRQIHDAVLQQETKLIRNRPDILVQAHGDFHPENIVLSHDRDKAQDFIAVIDFGSSYQLPRAFDVGTFMAQYINMFFEHRQIQQNAPVDIFYETYLAGADDLTDDFARQVDLFKARTCLSILYYLHKVGMADSENFWRVLVEAEKCLTSISVHTHNVG